MASQAEWYLRVVDMETLRHIAGLRLLGILLTLNLALGPTLLADNENEGDAVTSEQLKQIESKLDEALAAKNPTRFQVCTTWLVRVAVVGMFIWMIGPYLVDWSGTGAEKRALQEIERVIENPGSIRGHGLSNIRNQAEGLALILVNGTRANENQDMERVMEWKDLFAMVNDAYLEEKDRTADITKNRVAKPIHRFNEKNPRRRIPVRSLEQDRAWQMIKSDPTLKSVVVEVVEQAILVKLERLDKTLSDDEKSSITHLDLIEYYLKGF